MTTRKEQLAKHFPAERGSLAGALALLFTHLFGVTDSTVLTAVGTVLLCLPAIITGVIHGGGIVGYLRKLLFGG